MSEIDAPTTSAPEDLATLLPESPEATFNRTRTLTRVPHRDSKELQETAPLPEKGDSATRMAVRVPAAGGVAADGANDDGGADYALLRVIGSGGMGEVWEAEQRSLNRIVAVKRLNPRFAASQAASRADTLRLREEFRREALVSARLEHPNIVPVHDRGVDEEGNPLLAMKRVFGKPWNVMLREDFAAMPEADYLRKHLAILQQMALAVAFAHSKGIVHRDLKPAQVMVGEFGEVLLMDWGLAFFTGENPVDSDWVGRTGVTRQETASNPSGTVAYMAPEQTQHTPHGLGTWTDVYLLGATLYHVLTGTPPHRAATPVGTFERAKVGLLETPMSRAPERRIAAELEEICLRAMAVAPGDRLPSARAFHDALEAYQSGATRREESRQICERVASGAGSLRTYASFNDALAQVQRARQLWPENPSLDEVEERLLQANGELALAEGDLRLATVLADRFRDAAAKSAVRDRVRAAEQMQASRERQRRMLLVVSFTFLGLLVVAGAAFIWYIETSRRAIDQERSRAVAAEGEAERRRAEAVGERDRAEASRRESEELVTFVVEDLTTRLEAVGRLDVLDTVLTKVSAQMDQRAQRTLTAQEKEAMSRLLERIVDVRMAQGNLAEAEAILARALAMAEADAAASPGNVEALNVLGSVWARIGFLRMTKGENDSALEALLKFEEHAEKALALEPASTKLKYVLSTANGFVAQVMQALGRRAEALEGFLRMQARLQELLQTDSKNVEWRRDLAVSFVMRAVVQQAEGQLAEAEQAYSGALEILGGLLAEDPKNAALMRDLGANWLLRAAVLETLGRGEEAEAALRESLRMTRELVAIDVKNVTWRDDYQKVINRLGKLLRGTDRGDEALGLYRECIDTFDKALAESPEDGWLKSALADQHHRAGNTLRSLGQKEAAKEHYRAGVALLEGRPEITEGEKEDLAAMRDLLSE